MESPSKVYKRIRSCFKIFGLHGFFVKPTRPGPGRRGRHYLRCLLAIEDVRAYINLSD